MIENSNDHKQNVVKKKSRIIPKEFQFTDSILKQVTKPWVFICLILFLVFLVVCLGIKIYYLGSDIDHYYIDHAQDAHPYFGKKSADKYIRELDIAGLLGGIVGIILSIYITGVIEQLNSSKEEESKQLQETMAEALDKIWERERNFKAVDDIRGVITSIRSIFQTSINNGRQLYIMNHGASFGYLLGFKLHTILDYGDITLDGLKNLTYAEYFRKYDNFEDERKTAITKMHEIVGQSLVEKNGVEPVYVTLSPTQNKFGKIPYVENFLKEIFEDGTKIFFYDPLNTEKIREVAEVSEIKEIDNFYMVPLNTIQDQKRVEEIQASVVLNAEQKYAELKNLLLESFIKKQKYDIAALQSSHFSVRYVNNIYYQVYLNQIEGPNDEGYCVFMFVNHQTLTSSGKKLLAFESRKEKYVNDSFINIITYTQ